MTITSTMYSQVNDVNGGGNNGITFVQRYLAAGLTLPSGAISNIRITIEAPAAETCTITNSYVEHQAGSGDVYDFATTPAQFLWTGAANVSITAGNSKTSDWVAFVYDKSTALLVSLYMGGGVSEDGVKILLVSSTNYGSYSKTANDAATVNKTGYSGGMGGQYMLIKSIEVQSADATTSNFFYMF